MFASYRRMIRAARLGRGGDAGLLSVHRLGAGDGAQML